MPHPTPDNPVPAQRAQPALPPGERGKAAGPLLSEGAPDAPPPLTNAELVQLQIRVIALENLVVALLAHAPEQQLELVRDIAASIFPRPGVEHRLTVQAAAQMEHLSQRSRRLQGLLVPDADAAAEDAVPQNS